MITLRKSDFFKSSKTLQIFITSVILLAGCGQTTHNKSFESQFTNIHEEKAKKTINIIGHWLNEGKREKLMRELVNEFEFLNQDYTINLAFPEQLYFDRSKKNSELEFNSKVITAQQADWDIIRINNGYSEQADYMKDPMWSKEYLVDLSQYPEFVNNTIPELTSDSSKKRWKGMIPGPFLEGYNWTIWYNQTLAKTLGINVKQIGMTYDDLLDYVKAIDKYNQSHKTSIIPIQECIDWSTINVLTQSLFLSEVNNINECLEDSYNEDKLKALYKTLRVFEELSKYHAWSTDYKSTVWAKTQDYPLKHKAFFYINASWMYNIWQGIDNKEVDNMVPAELPVFKPGKVYFGGYFCTWAIPKNSPHKEDAVKFLLFMNRPDIAEKWSRYTKCSTGIKGTLSEANFGSDHFEEFISKIQQKYGIHKMPWVDDASLILGVSHLHTNLHAIDVATGSMSADEAMAEIKKSLKR